MQPPYPYRELWYLTILDSEHKRYRYRTVLDHTNGNEALSALCENVDEVLNLLGPASRSSKATVASTRQMCVGMMYVAN